MAFGKKTGGRQKGTPNKATVAKAAEIEASGVTPLDYMIKVMRADDADPHRRDDMAKAAAPYVHHKLSAIEHTGKDGGPIETADTSNLYELARRIAFVLSEGAESKSET